MKALISPNEFVTQADGSTILRVCEVAANPFDVAEPLFWVDCPDDLASSQFGFLDGAFVAITYPEPELSYTMPVSDFGA